jgi:hypothetical protein
MDNHIVRIGIAAPVHNCVAIGEKVEFAPDNARLVIRWANLS